MAHHSLILRFHQLINGGRGNDYEEIAKMIYENVDIIGSRVDWLCWETDQSQTALAQAIFAGNHALFSFLLEMGADVNQPTKPQSYQTAWLPLHCAIYKNDVVMAQSLLAYGADPNLSIVSYTEVDGKNARDYANYMVYPDVAALF